MAYWHVWLFALVMVRAQELTFVAYNDVYELASVNGRGGASRFSKLLQELRVDDPELIVAFAGDTLSPSLWSTIFKGTHMIKGHNQLGCDVAGVGNHEFDYGKDVFYNAAEKSNFPWLCANCFDAETNSSLNGTQEHIIRDIRGVKVGFFGVIYDTNSSVSSGILIKDTIEIANNQVAKLKQKGAEFIVAITHQTWQEDNVFASMVNGIDLIIGGHDHEMMVQTQYGTPYVKADSDFKNIWVIKVLLGEGKAKHVMDFQNIPITQDMAVDPVMEAMIGNYSTYIEEEFNVCIGKTNRSLDLRESTTRRKDSDIGYLFANGFRHAYATIPSDIGIMNGGGFRTNEMFTNESITLGNALSWSPFENYIVHMQLPIEGIMDYVQVVLQDSCGASGLTQVNPVFPHVAGIQVDFQCLGQNKGKILRFSNEHGVLFEPKSIVVAALTSYSYELHRYVFERVGAKVLVDAREALMLNFVVAQEIKRLAYVELPNFDRVHIKW